MSFCCNKSINKDIYSTKTEKTRRYYLLFGMILMLSEIWKQYTLTFILNNGEYQWSYIPFQLCSVPMYLCLFLGLAGLKNSIRRACMVFLADYTLMSGVVTFLDTSGLHYGYAPLTIHSYLWHIIIAGIGVYSGLKLISDDAFEESGQEQIYSTGEEKQSGSCCRKHLQKTRKDRLKQRLAVSDFIPASCIFLICCGIAELINLSLDRYGIVNMFYINPHYYVNQIVFYDLAHIIPNNIVILLYILCAVLAAFIVHIVWMIFTKERLKKMNSHHCNMTVSPHINALTKKESGG